MITAWKCKCGQENSIISRYCHVCSEEIPQEYISLITNEEVDIIKGIIQRETYENRQARAEKRHALAKKTYNAAAFTTILIFAIIAFLFWQVYVGTLSMDIFVQNVTVLKDKVIGKTTGIAIGGFEIVKGKIVRITAGLTAFIDIQKNKGITVGSSWMIIKGHIVNYAQELVKNINRINIIERIKGVINEFSK